MNAKLERALRTSAALGFSVGLAGAGCSGESSDGSSTAGSSAAGSAGSPMGGSGAAGAGGAVAGSATGGNARGGVSGAQSGASSGGAPSTGGSGAASGGKSSGGASASAGSGGAAAGQANTGGSGGGGTSGARSPGCGNASYPMSGNRTIDVSGTQREYILDVPANYNPNTAYRLVFGWHWRGGTADNVANGSLGGGAYYGLERLANGGAIFVAPNGIDNGWANTGGRDIAFARAMVDFFKANLCIDTTRVFSTGFSYGGMMSDAIGCDMADVFRAIAPMAGALYSGCNRSNTQPIAVWMSHGTSDDVVPIADGRTALGIFLRKNGCGTQTSPVEPSPCVAYQGCMAGYPVHFCEFAGGHQAPSFAGAAIWSFFNQF